MANPAEYMQEVQNIIDTPWNQRGGQKIPETTEVALAGGAVEIEATFLYADLANSSLMAKELDRRLAAKIIKSFLATSARLIRENNGKIVSFDGDRVLGVFYDGCKNSNAAKCALNITYVVDQVIRKKFETQFSSVRNASFTITHGVGIDTGTVLVVRAGARGDNDLIWIGRAPNLAAKLSDLRLPNYPTHITATVYFSLLDWAKYQISTGQVMWDGHWWNFLGENIQVFRSSWHWKPSN